MAIDSIRPTRQDSNGFFKGESPACVGSTAGPGGFPRHDPRRSGRSHRCSGRSSQRSAEQRSRRGDSRSGQASQARSVGSRAVCGSAHHGAIRFPGAAVRRRQCRRLSPVGRRYRRGCSCKRMGGPCAAICRTPGHAPALRRNECGVCRNVRRGQTAAPALVVGLRNPDRRSCSGGAGGQTLWTPAGAYRAQELAYRRTRRHGSGFCRTALAGPSGANIGNK